MNGNRLFQVDDSRLKLLALSLLQASQSCKGCVLFFTHVFKLQIERSHLTGVPLVDAFDVILVALLGGSHLFLELLNVSQVSLLFGVQSCMQGLQGGVEFVCLLLQIRSSSILLGLERLTVVQVKAELVCGILLSVGQMTRLKFRLLLGVILLSFDSSFFQSVDLAVQLCLALTMLFV